METDRDGQRMFKTKFYVTVWSYPKIDSCLQHPSHLLQNYKYNSIYGLKINTYLQQLHFTCCFLSPARRGTSEKKCLRSAVGSLFFWGVVSSSDALEMSETCTSMCIPSASISAKVDLI